MTHPHHHRNDTSGAAVAGFILSLVGLLGVLGAPAALAGGVINARTNDELHDNVIVTFVGLAIFPIVGGLLGMGGIDNAYRHRLGGAGLGRAAQILSCISIALLALYALGIWAQLDERISDDTVTDTTRDQAGAAPPTSVDHSTSPAAIAGTLPPGLLCRDVAGRGEPYGVAFEYWVLEGTPDRMDEDLNGVPCETVYEPVDINAYEQQLGGTFGG